MSYLHKVKTTTLTLFLSSTIFIFSCNNKKNNTYTQVRKNSQDNITVENVANTTTSSSKGTTYNPDNNFTLFLLEFASNKTFQKERANGHSFSNFLEGKGHIIKIQENEYQDTVLCNKLKSANVLLVNTENREIHVLIFKKENNKWYLNTVRMAEINPANQDFLTFVYRFSKEQNFQLLHTKLISDEKENTFSTKTLQKHLDFFNEKVEVVLHYFSEANMQEATVRVEKIKKNEATCYHFVYENQNWMLKKKGKCN